MREQFQKEADATRGVCIYLESIDTTLRHVRTFFLCYETRGQNYWEIKSMFNYTSTWLH